MTLRHLSLFRHHFIPMIQTGYPLYSLNAASICLRRIRGRTISSGRRGWQKKAGQIVGRITAQIDTLHRECYGEDTGHFGMIDSIDDPQVLPRCLVQRKRGWSHKVQVISAGLSAWISIRKADYWLKVLTHHPVRWCRTANRGMPRILNNWDITKVLIYWRGGCNEPISRSLRR